MGLSGLQVTIKLTHLHYNSCHGKRETNQLGIPASPCDYHLCPEGVKLSPEFPGVEDGAYLRMVARLV